MNAAEIIRPAFVPGVYTRHELANADYHAIDALSASGTKRIMQSPLHYRYDREHSTEPTDAMLMGTALHCAVLEPDRFEDEVIAVPDDAPRRPAARSANAKKPSLETLDALDFWRDFDRRAAGKTVLKAEAFEKVRHMAASVQRLPAVQTYLCDGEAEYSMLWNDARLGIPCKCRFDYLRPDGIALDLKSCQDASPEGFARAVAQFKYHWQAAFYNNGHEHVRDASLRVFLFIAVESVAPYCAASYVLEPNAIAFGANRVEEAMLLYRQATETGYWRGYSEKIQPVRLPRWATTLVESY